jgi:hypothetical protein
MRGGYLSSGILLFFELVLVASGASTKSGAGLHGSSPRA